MIDRALGSLALAALVMSGAAACKKNDQDTQTGYQQGQPQTQPGMQPAAGTQPGTQPAGTQPAGTQPAGTQPAGTQPAGTQPAGTQPAGTQPAGTQPAGTQPAGTQPAGTPAAGGKATQLDATAGAVVQPILNELAKKETVAGAKPVGTAMVGNFATGSVLETQIQLQPNKCYSIVATSLPPVTELNVQLVAVAPIPGLAPVLAADSDTGPSAVVGRKPNCYKWALPLAAPAKVVVTVAGGSGLAAAQLYEK
jgi:hypothetical protein